MPACSTIRSCFLFGGLAAVAASLAGLASTGATPSLTPGAGPQERDLAQDAAIQDMPTYPLRFGKPGALPRQDGAVRLVTYNVANLFDEIDDPTLSGRNEDIDDAKPLHERVAVERAIRELDADVLTLQEIESEAALRWFVENHLQGMGYDHIVSIDAGNSRGIENAVLSRHPITEMRLWPGMRLGGVFPEENGDREDAPAGAPMRFRRSPLWVTVSINDTEDAQQQPYELGLMIVHKKSGRGEAAWRMAESRMIADLLDEITQARPELNIAVLGDFNDRPGDPSVRALTATGLIDVFETPKAASVDADSELVTHESGRRIDLILVNRNLMRELVAGSAFVLGTGARPEGVDWRVVRTFANFASDHYPVSVDLVPRERSAGRSGGN